MDDAWTSGTLEYAISGLTNGTAYEVQVRAVNSLGDGAWSATATGTPDGAPTADAGVAQTVLEGVTVTLDGSGSRDPEGQALAYAWTAPAGVTLSDTAAAAPTFTAPTLGSDADYTFTLVVNDGVQDSPQASVTIAVEVDVAPSFGTQTVADLGEVAQIAMADLVLPAATGGNGTLTYALACAAGATGCTGTPALPPGLSFDAATRTLGGTPTATGTTTLTYIVTDTDTNTAATDAAKLDFDITVDANQAPTADAGVAQTVLEGVTVTLDGSGSRDPEGQALAYAWTAPAGVTLSDTAAAAPTFTAPTLGSDADYTFTLVVNDGVQDSPQASVTIAVEVDVAPSFGTQTVADLGEVAQIAMADLVLPAATGGNGTLTYALACAAGATGCTGTPALPPGLSFDAATRTLGGTPTATGTTTLTYTVTDTDTNTAATDAAKLDFDITVDANQAPTADAGVAQTVLEGVTVTLDGSGSRDPEGQALAYAWTAPAGVTLSDTAAAAPTFPAPTLGSDADYTFTLVVNDGVQDSPQASVTIAVEVDAAPSFGTQTVADLGEVAQIAMADLVLPAATGGNGMLTYALACAAGATGCTGTPALPPGLSFDAATRTLGGTPTNTGTTTLTYTVTDTDTNTAATDAAKLDFDITVDANQAPTADAGVAQTVLEGVTVTLDGSGSRDPEGQALAYAWTAPAGITLSDTAAAAPTFTAPTLGSDADYTFTLVVNDGVQDSPQASVTIAVEVDVAPSFGTQTVADLGEVAQIAMADLVLPAATGGNGTLTYALACAAGATGCTGTPALPPGLSFDAATRTLGGTPTATGTTTLTYTVTDTDTNTAATDAAKLDFDITVDANQAPTADAGVAQTVLEGVTVTLDGSGSRDPEGQALAYAWTAPAGVTLSDTAAAAPTFTAPTLGSDADYTFTLVVNDGVQDSPQASVTIAVEVDVAPSFGTQTVADLGEVAQIAMADLVLPAATGGNGTLTYALACAAGATGCTGTPALPPGLSFDAATRTLGGTPTATGTTTLTYIVTDTDTNTAATDAAKLDFDITVDANQAPTADAGVAQTVLEGVTVTLDGSGSRDPEGQALAYAWTAPAGVTLSDTAAAAPTFTAPKLGSDADYTFTLVVNDGVQDSPQASVTIAVEVDVAPSFGTQTVADLGEVAQIAMADLVLPAATGGNGTLTYALACAAGATGCTGTPALPPGLSFDAATRTLGGTPTATGTTTLTYIVTDTDTNTAATDAAKLDFDITVDANQAPTADAGVAQTVLEGVTVTLDGSGSRDPEGQALAYAWTAPAGVTLSDTAAAAPTFTAPTLGSDADYTFTLVVNDGVQDSPQASVTIAVEVDVAPSFGTQTVADLGEVAQIAMADLVLPAATGGNGTLTYALACAAGATGCTGTPALPPGLSFDAATRTLGGTPTTTGTTTLTYTVTDTDTNTAATDAAKLDFDITVDANQAPTADAGVAQTVLEGVTVTLDGSGSRDPEGQALAYAWTAPAGVTLSDTAAAAPTFTAPTLGSDADYTFTLVVNDGVQDSPQASVTIAVEVDVAPSFGTQTVADLGEVAQIAMADLVLPAATGGNGTLTYALACAAGATGCTGTPALPPGLSFDAATRTLGGTPTATGTTTLTYIVTDTDTNTAATDAAKLDFDIVVEAHAAPLFAPEMVDNLKPQNYIVGNAVELRLPELTLGNGTNGEHDYKWTGEDGSSTLPDGLSFESSDPAALKITGTPTVPKASTEYILTVTDRDGDAAAMSLHIAVIEIMGKPPGSVVSFDEETGEIMLRRVNFRDGGGQPNEGASQLSLPITVEAARIALPAGHTVSQLTLSVANLMDNESMSPEPGIRFGVVALEISPNGDLGGGKATVCLSTDGVPPGKAPMLYHEEPAEVWTRIDTEMRTEVDLICGNVSTFSSFGVASEAGIPTEMRKQALEHVLAAFGRTVATDAVSVLSDRMEHASRDGTGSGITLAGRKLDLRGTMPAHDRTTVRTGGDRATAGRNEGWRGTGWDEPDPWADPAGSESLISERELLTGTSFRLTLGAEDDGTSERGGFAGGRATLWGGGRTAGFEGLSIDGDVVSGWLGLDWHRRDLLLGLAISHSRGEMDYRDNTNAEIELDLTSVHPYARLSLDEGLDVWGILGFGAGDLKFVDGGNETDIGMRMAAAGVRRALGPWSEHGIDFAVKADALAVVMRSDPRGLDSDSLDDDLPGVNVSAQRLRLAVEGEYTRALKSRGLVRSTLDLGARYDRGGAQTGAGVDIAGVVLYEDPTWGLTVEGSGRVMLAHAAEGFEEWGLGGAIRLSPDGNGRGLSFSVEPSWGVAASGAERLWSDGVPAGADSATRRGRVEAELGYGLGGPGGRGLLTPYFDASVTEGEGQDYGAGVRFRLEPGFELDVGGGYRESGNGEATLGAGLQLSVAF